MSPTKPSKPKKRRKRRAMPGPFRKEVPARETRVGLVLLVLLGLCAALIAWKSGHWEHDLFEAVSPEPRTTGLANTIREPLRGARLAGLVGSAARAPDEARRSRLEDLAALLPAKIPGSPRAREFVRVGAVELFPEQRISDKIDGRADLYLEHGVVGLACASYAASGGTSPGGTSPGDAVSDVYFFLMRSPRRAFGIFAAERRAGVGEAGVGDASYIEGGACFFQKAAVYAHVLGGEGLPDAALRALAEACASFVPGAGADPEMQNAIARLPAEGRVAASLEYDAEAAFGYTSLVEVFHAEYEQGAGVAPALCWVSLQADAERAKSVQEAFLGELGARVEHLAPPASEDLADASFFARGGRVFCIYRWGKQLGGVVDAKDRATCEQLTERLMSSMERQEAREEAAREFR